MSEELIGAAAITCRFAIAFVFLIAAIPKLVERREFERTVANYSLLPSQLVPAAATWLPRLELACALLLLLGIATALVAAVTALLLATFAVAVAVNLVRGREMSCGCFSTVAPRSIGWSLVVGDLLLAGMAALVVLRAPDVLALAQLSGETGVVSTGEAVGALVLGGCLTLGFLLLSAWRGFDSAARTFEYEGGAT
jgi:uncharacterized membrane protein YphA (DoxX/SURF4 family)